MEMYYTAPYYTAPNFFRTIVSSSVISWSVTANLHKYVNAVLVKQFKISHTFLLSMFKIIRNIKIVLVVIKWLKLFCRYSS